MVDKVKLPSDKLAQLMQAQRNLGEILPELDDAEKCGIDCSDLRHIATSSIEQISKLVKYFGPIQ